MLPASWPASGAWSEPCVFWCERVISAVYRPDTRAEVSVDAETCCPQAEAPDQGGAACRDARADSRCGRVSVLQIRPERRHPAGCGVEGGGAHLAHALLL